MKKNCFWLFAALAPLMTILAPAAVIEAAVPLPTAEVREY